MQRKRSYNHFNQSFGRVPVRSCSTNEFSFADAYFQRLDYKAFAEREQCVSTPKTQINSQRKQTSMNQNQSFAAFIGLDKSDKKINANHPTRLNNFIKNY
jgi:hypothetical protein